MAPAIAPSLNQERLVLALRRRGRPTRACGCRRRTARLTTLPNGPVDGCVGSQSIECVGHTLEVVVEEVETGVSEHLGLDVVEVSHEELDVVAAEDGEEEPGGGAWLNDRLPGA